MRLSSSCSALMPWRGETNRELPHQAAPRRGFDVIVLALGQRLLTQALGNLAIRHGLADTRDIAGEHGVKARRPVGAVELGGDAEAELFEIICDALALPLVARIDQHGLHRAGGKRRRRAAQDLELGAIDVKLDMIGWIELKILDETNRAECRECAADRRAFSP